MNTGFGSGVPPGFCALFHANSSGTPVAATVVATESRAVRWPAETCVTPRGARRPPSIAPHRAPHWLRGALSSGRPAAQRCEAGRSLAGWGAGLHFHRHRPEVPDVARPDRRRRRRHPRVGRDLWRPAARREVPRRHEDRPRLRRRARRGDHRQGGVVPARGEDPGEVPGHRDLRGAGGEPRRGRLRQALPLPAGARAGRGQVRAEAGLSRG